MVVTKTTQILILSYSVSLSLQSFLSKLPISPDQHAPFSDDPHWTCTSLEPVTSRPIATMKVAMILERSVGEQKIYGRGAGASAPKKNMATTELRGMAETVADWRRWSIEKGRVARQPRAVPTGFGCGAKDA
jgi:hypothetical protein